MSRDGPSMLRRLLLISDHLKTGRHFSCVSLGRELEVHARTIRRDLDFLRDECGAPLEWEPTTKTWFLNGHWEGFGSLRLDSAESLALILAEQSFRRVRHTPIATALHAILEKIAQSAGENLRHSWESLAKTVHPTGQTTAEIRAHEHFASIADAIRKKRVLRIHYLKPGEAEAQQRRIHPLGLAELDQRWTVIACDPNADGDGIRKFLLARMEHCRRLAETFSTPTDFNLDTYLGGSVGLFTSDSIYTVEAEFSAYAAPYLREAPHSGIRTGNTLRPL